MIYLMLYDLPHKPGAVHFLDVIAGIPVHDIHPPIPHRFPCALQRKTFFGCNIALCRKIVTDIDFLEKPLEKVESAEEVKELARDLLDTAKHHGKRHHPHKHSKRLSDVKKPLQHIPFQAVRRNNGNGRFFLCRWVQFIFEH